MKPHRTLLAVGIGLYLGSLAVSAPPVVAPGDLARIQALIKPSAEEAKWDRIPWRTSLWDARKEAAEQGKPILLWEMDGHPLACT